MTIRETLLSAEARLREAGVPDPALDVQLLLSAVTGMSRMELSLGREASISAQQEQRFSSLLLSRARREPLQYLLGERCFYGLDFKTDARALIPRQETETLCEHGLRFLRERALPAPRVLDLCTGSGAVAVVIKRECPAALVAASDLSAEALSLARENARLNGADVRFLQGDLLAPVAGERFDLILCNPPYIPDGDMDALQPEVQREPRMALAGGADGLDFYRRIARETPACLAPQGMLAVEAGDGQATAVSRLFAQAGLCAPAVQDDLYGHARVVSARLSGTPT